MAKIKEIRCIRTRVNGTWVIVKVSTDQPGLYGIGSASDPLPCTNSRHGGGGVHRASPNWSGGWAY